MTFEKKEISTGKSLGVRLQTARLEKNIPLSDLAKKTKIRIPYLQQIEDGKLEELEFDFVYIKKMIMLFAKGIGEDPAQYVFQFEKDYSSLKKSSDSKKFSIKDLRDIPTQIRLLFFIISVVVIILYLTLQINSIVKPPEITIHSPLDGEIISSQSIEVIGETGKEVFVTINGQKITSDGTGHFSQMIDLSPGVNTVVISANRKHGKSVTITRYVVYKTPGLN